MTLPNELHPALFSSGVSREIGQQSLRFDAGYLTRTPTSSGNRTTFTISFWIKQSELSTYQYWFSTYGSSANDGNFTITHGNDNALSIGLWTAEAYKTNALLRDTTAWYHFVISVNGTSGNVYMNGVNQTSSISEAWNSTYAWNHTQTHTIGRNTYNTNYQGHGYLSDVYNIDGLALTPTSFGEFNSNGVWVPILYEGDFGTNGFHLTFDSSQPNGIGHDSSGKDNHWTATGFVTSDISSSNPDNDIDYFDTPLDNYTTLNPLDPDSGYTLDKGNLRIQLTTDSNGIRNTQYLTSGKWYWETYVTTISGNNTYFGIERNNAPNGNADRIYLRTNNGSILVYNSATQTGLTAVTAGDVVAIRLDLDNSQISWYVNNTQLGTTETFATNDGDQWAVFMGNGNTGTLKDLKYNFGQMPFIYSLPSGYKEIKYSNLSTPAIPDGGEHFGSITYTGPISHTTTTTGETANVTGVSFTPDFVWVKNRTNANWHVLVDRIRVQSDGDGFLASNDTAAEQTNLNGSVSGFVSPSSDTASDGGFTVISGSDSSAKVNLTASSNYNYVGWCWKAGGAASANYDGSITSQVSANQTAGFSIVSYTGTGSAATVGHGLSQAPEMVITKNRGATQYWIVQHAGLSGVTYNLYLHLYDSEQNDTQYTAIGNSTLTLNAANNSVNTSGNNYISYCWHSVEGFSKMGSFIGNGSTDGPFVHCGFKPAWVLIKRVNNGGGYWVLWDSSRSPTNLANSIGLSPGETWTDTAGFNLDLLSNGFKMRDTESSLNISGSTYIFTAFAEHPAGGLNVSPSTAR